jgi:6-phosphofructokinase 1
MVVVAEGARASDGEIVTKETSRKGEALLGGIGEQVAKRISEATGKETRCMVLGHLQRGGAPTSLDRILATRFGVHAVDLIRQGKFGHMVSYQNYLVSEVPIAVAVNQLKRVKPDNQILKACRELGISFGD